MVSIEESITQSSIKNLMLCKQQRTLLKKEFSNRSFEKGETYIKQNIGVINMKGKIQPAHKIQIGSLSMTLWLNEVDSGAIVPSVSLQKRYYDKDDKVYKDATSFNAVDLPVLALMSNMMCEYIVEKVNITQKILDK